MRPLVYSAGLKLPRIKPPRLDLRNRTQHTSKSPSKPKPPVSQPKDPLRVRSFADPFSTRIGDTYDGLTSTGFITDFADEAPQEVLVDDGREVYMVFNEKDWVFTQATAVASVNVVPDRDWQIAEDSIPYINSNANAWETEYLRQCYKTFKGAMNLKDHVAPEEGGQIYGMIIDAVPRRIKTGLGDNYVLYIDTIIATNKHIDPQWADAIRRGTIRFLSVGFNCNFLVCTKCGHIYGIDDTGICQHCLFELGLAYYDEFGRRSSTAAMCANIEGVDNTGEFVELSYLSVNPAFEGAAKAYTLALPKDTDVKVKMPRIALKKPAYQDLKKWIKVKKIEEVPELGM